MHTAAATFAFSTLASAGSHAATASPPAPTVPYGPQLEGFDYPHPVQRFRFTSQQQPLEMACMDVKPSATPSGRTVVLLHGKNFCGATWQETIRVLSAAGHGVVAPDQIGFCASTKPTGYQFSFEPAILTLS